MYKLLYTYGLKPSDCILRIEDRACIPMDESNVSYQEYLAWLAEGNEPEPADGEEE